MIILSIDTTGQTASVALVDENHTIGEFTVSNKMTHSQILMPMIDHLINTSQMALENVDYIACAQGPGSFTGIRIGAAAAKALAHGLNKLMIPVPTLDGLAYNVYNRDYIVIPVMDARRKQVYSAFYSWKEGRLVRLTEEWADELVRVLEKAACYDKAVFLGDGALLYGEEIQTYNPGFSLAPANSSLQRAASVGALALELAKKGEAIPYDRFVPFYLRKPQAERERENKQ